MLKTFINEIQSKEGAELEIPNLGILKYRNASCAMFYNNYLK